MTPWDPQDIADDLLGRARMPFWGERTALAPEELPTLKECDLGKTDWIIAFWWRGYRGAPQAVLAPLRVERVRQGNESNEAGVMWAGSPRQDH